MNKIIASLLLLFALQATSPLCSQNVKFKKYFTDATLRIDYLRVGNRHHDTVNLSSIERIDNWAGSLTQLLDPFDNGDYRIVVADPASGRQLYSRGYNTLFQEYRDTPQGADSIAAFQEVVRVPWPPHRRHLFPAPRPRPAYAHPARLPLRPRRVPRPAPPAVILAGPD